MTLQEAHKELLGLRQHLKKLDTDKLNVQKQIDEKLMEKQLEQIEEAQEREVKLEKDWTAIITPVIEELRKKLKRKVKEAKVKKGYDRVNEVGAKLQMQNQILGPITAELDVEMDDPVVKEIKANFDKI